MSRYPLSRPMRPFGKGRNRKGESVKSLLEALGHDPENEDGSREIFRGDLDSEISTLKDIHKLLSKKETFEPGDIVKWKPGLRCRIAEYGQPMIVLSLANEVNRGLKPDDNTSPFYGEPLDLRVGYRNKGTNNFVSMLIDARTVTHHPGVLTPQEKNILDSVIKMESERYHRPPGLPKEELAALEQEFDAREAQGNAD